MNPRPLLILVDGSNYFYRENIAHLRSARGEASGAIWGSTQFIEQLYANRQPAAMAIVYDTPAPTFRHQLLPSYKGQREAMPADLQAQIEPLQTLLSALGYAVLSREGVEADDVLASLVRQGLDEGFRVMLLSGDKDLLQLLRSPEVEIIDGSNRYTAADVAKRFRLKQDLRPEQIPAFLALTGDASDNIPGLSGVGSVTAARWLQRFGDLESIIQNAAQLKEQTARQIPAAAAQLRFNLQLTRLRDDLDLGLRIADLARRPVQPEALQPICERFSLSQLKQRYIAAQPRNYRRIADVAEWEKLRRRLEALPYFALDTETSGLNVFQAELVGISLAVAEGEAYYLPLAHRRGVGLLAESCPENLPWSALFPGLKALLENENIGKIGQNLKFDAHVLQRHGIQLRGIIGDSMLLSYVFHSSGKHDLDSLARYYLQEQTQSYEALTDKGKRCFSELPLDEATAYAAEDADMSWRLHHYFMQQLPESLLRLYQDIELPLLPVLQAMEARGVRLDAAALERQSAALTLELQSLQEEMDALAGEPVNGQSPKQLQRILFERLQLPIIKKTPGGQASTDESVLQQLAEEHALPRVLLQYRALSKLKSTYTEALPRLLEPHSGRLHTQYNQALTSTGRLSSSQPNLQNIPIKSAAGQEIRRAFIPAAGWTMIAADYSQIELRILAHFSQDEGLLKAFRSGQDVHRQTAAELLDIEPEAVTREQRRQAKTINFGLMYGMSAFGLARALQLELSEAQSYMDRYFQRFPRILAQMERFKQQGRALGYVETILGRRIHLPDLQQKNQKLRQEAERLAINAPIQGSAADLMKKAMLDVHALLRGREDVHLLMQVHDELVFEALQPTAELLQAIRTRMEQALPLSLPLVVDIRAAENWLAAH